MRVSGCFSADYAAARAAFRKTAAAAGAAFEAHHNPATGTSREAWKAMAWERGADVALDDSAPGRKTSLGSRKCDAAAKVGGGGAGGLHD